MSYSGKKEKPGFEWIAGPVKTLPGIGKHYKFVFFGMTEEGELRKWLLVYYGEERKFKVQGLRPSDKEAAQIANPAFKGTGRSSPFPSMTIRNPKGKLTDILVSMLSDEKKAMCMALTLKQRQVR
jgi:hypothetical protein